MTKLNNKAWQLKAITEALGDLVIDIDDSLTVGRGKDNDVVLGSKQVSRQHAELNILNGELFIKDLGSSNGTLVNDVKIDANKSKHLQHSDTVSFATFNFIVNQGSSQPVSQPKNIEPALGTSLSPTTESTSTTPTPEQQAVPQKQPVTHKETPTAQEDYPVKTEDVDGITQAKLKEELEIPIPMGDPNQDTHHQDSQHKATTQPVDKENGTVHTRQDDETSAEHFEELAAEADSDVLRAKQAAAAKFSGTVDVNHDEPQSTLNPKPTSSSINPASNTHNTTPTAQVQPAMATGSGNGKWIMIILVIIIIALAIWLFSSGAAA